MDVQSVLITGGAGFIGSHLAESFLAEGREVTIIDDLSTGKWMNIEHLHKNPHLKVIIASANEKDLIEKEVPKHDLVYHLASAVGVKLIIEQPVKTVESIFQTTDVVLKACSRYRRPVLLTSTSEVYGKLKEIPFHEDMDVVLGATSKRRWAYACAKALDEFLALAHYYETRLSVYIVRLFNTVGPRQTGRYGMVLPNFVQQALRGIPLTVYGDGKQQRCFCSVFDALEALKKIPRIPKTVGKVINIGSQEEVTMEELAERVIRLCESESKIEYIPYEQAYGAGFDDMKRRVPDLTRAQELIQWKPKMCLDEIIIQVANYIRKTL